MALTPIDIQQKTFGPELRGYNMDEVDDFLDEVVAALKDYDQRVRDAQDRIRALEVELSTRGEDESAISRALVAAQKQADNLVADAHADAERIRGDAHDEATRLRADREAERLSLTQDIARMRASVADLKRRVVELSASAGADLDAMDQAAASASEAVAGDFNDFATHDDVDVFSEETDAITIEDVPEIEEIQEIEEIEDVEGLEDVAMLDEAGDVEDELETETDLIDGLEDEFEDQTDDAARSGQHMAGDVVDGLDDIEELDEIEELTDPDDPEALDDPPSSRRPWERGSV